MKYVLHPDKTRVMVPTHPPQERCYSGLSHCRPGSQHPSTSFSLFLNYRISAPATFLQNSKPKITLANPKEARRRHVRIPQKRLFLIKTVINLQYQHSLWFRSFNKLQEQSHSLLQAG